MPLYTFLLKQDNVGSDDDEDDDDQYDDYADDDMRHLLDNLPSDARQKILSKKNLASSRDNDNEDESDEDDDDGVAEGGWGRKKSSYYSGATADLEIGQVHKLHLRR